MGNGFVPVSTARINSCNSFLFVKIRALYKLKVKSHVLLVNEPSFKKT
jgi:hypothetical protein